MPESPSSCTKAAIGSVLKGNYIDLYNYKPGYDQDKTWFTCSLASYCYDTGQLSF
jgi:hypothetical protein